MTSDAAKELRRGREMVGAARLGRSAKGVEWRVLDPDEWEAALDQLSLAQIALAAERTAGPRDVAVLLEPVTEDEVTVMMTAYTNPRAVTLGEKFRRGLAQVLSQRAAS